VERHVDDAGLHPRHDVHLAAELAAGEHLDFHRAAGLGGDEFGELRRDSLRRMEVGVGVAELERDRRLREGAPRPPDRRHGECTGCGGSQEVLAGDGARGHEHPPCCPPEKRDQDRRPGFFSPGAP
jgi:hypothetical protein